MSRTVLRNANVVDGTGTQPAVADVLVEDGKIIEVGSGLDADEGVDLDGHWLLPGLIDCHVHATISTISLMRLAQEPFSLQFYEAARNLEATLRAGFTSVRDAGGADLGIKTAVERGLITGPRMKIAVTILSQTGGHGDGWFPCARSFPLLVPHPGRPHNVCDGPADVLRATRTVLRAGADVVKICTSGGVLSERDDPRSSQFLPEEIEVIVAEAAAHRVTVMAHAQGTDGIKNAVRAGVSSIEHGIYLDDEAIGMMLEAGTFLVPTLVAAVGVLEAPEGVSEASLRKARDVVEEHRHSIARAVDAGVRIAMGTDSGVVPHGRNARELEAMVGVGMSPSAAIEAATRVAAENLGVIDQRGTIEPGKDADLLAVSADPIADISVLADPAKLASVWLGGVPVAGAAKPAM